MMSVKAVSARDRSDRIPENIELTLQKAQAVTRLAQAARDHDVKKHPASAGKIEERNRLRDMVKEYQRRLEKVHELVHRYESVAEPVVANDGYTYEKPVISKYITDCQAAGMPAKSNQATDVTLNTDLFANRTLQRMVVQMTAIKLPADMGSQPPKSVPLMPATHPPPSTGAAPFYPPTQAKSVPGAMPPPAYKPQRGGRGGGQHQPMPRTAGSVGQYSAEPPTQAASAKTWAPSPSASSWSPAAAMTSSKTFIPGRGLM